MTIFSNIIIKLDTATQQELFFYGYGSIWSRFTDFFNIIKHFSLDNKHYIVISCSFTYMED